MQALLRRLGVLNSKHIPLTYLRSSEQQRRALLAGLLDTNGTASRSGSVEITLCDAQLAHNVRELIVSLGYRCGWRTKQVLGRSEWTSTAYTLSFTATDDVFRLSRKFDSHRSRRANRGGRTGKRFITGVRRIVSLPVRCVQVDNEAQLYLAGPSMIPTHNSTLALDLCRSASLRHGLASVIFSLEMNRTEITMRLLSAEAKIALHSMRNGKMNEDDWARLARRMAEVSEAPLFIDDSPNMTMMEIRAKARRLKQRHDLRLIVVDYLQLMTSGRRVESRQVEVSEFSRQMKLLAKELEVPVVAVSQLNRGAEQRTDKRPLLSDLRESGCLTASTRLLRADNGAEVTLGELLTEKSRDVPVWSLDDRLKLVPRTLTHAFPSGSQPTYRVRLASGREVEATANHPFLTLDGWTRLDRLAVADRVGVLRHAPAPFEVTRWSDDHVVRTAQRAARHHGLPASVFGLPKRQVALFVRHLWAPYGSIDWDGVNNEARIRCGWPSRRLADDVARLLLRVNVLSHIAERPGRNGRPVWQLSVPGIDNQKRFCDEVWAPGTAGRWVLHVQRMLADVEPTTDLVTIPPDVWARVVDALRAPVGGGAPARAPHPSGHSSPAPAEGAGRTRLASVAAVLDDSAVDVVATNDVFWDEIAAVEELGEQPVFDATVLGTHNFVANGIALHNSLEQDADLVILLHREDMYERESTRPGEADVIVAKHRAGPTSTVVVSFQGHFARFVDMARM
ncbi:MAG: AAA family ATPase [Actinomycetota bacterium]|nr:AAA family ATPase [Actinomycetota bacterium]